MAVGTGSHRQTLLVPEVAAEDEIQGTGAALWADEVGRTMRESREMLHKKYFVKDATASDLLLFPSTSKTRTPNRTGRAGVDGVRAR